MRVPSFIAAFLVFPVSLAAQVEPSFDVGFVAFEAVDLSRTFAGRPGRPVHVAVWYPAKHRKSDRYVPYSRYLELWARKPGVDTATADRVADAYDHWRGELVSYGNPSSDTAKILDSCTSAVEGAEWSEGSFPLLVYCAGGGGESFENSLLAEHLASRGWVFAAIPSIGTKSVSMDVNPIGLETAARDMEFAMSVVISMYAPDHLEESKIALAGWSWGGLAAMLVDARNDGIDAVVSLDGSIAMQVHNFKKTAFYAPSAVRTPHLFFTVESREARHRGFIDESKYAMHSLISLKQIQHGDFTSFSHLALSVAEELNEVEKTRKEFYPLMVETVGRYLRETVLGEGDFEQVLSKLEEQFPSMTVFQNEPLPNPISREDLLTLLSSDFATAMQKRCEARTINPEYHILSWRETIDAAYALYFDCNMHQEALAFITDALEEFPDQHQLIGHVGRFHERLDNLDAARQFLERAMEIASSEPPSFDRDDDLRFYRSRLKRIQTAQDSNDR